MTIFKACDIRGVVGKEWGAAEARRIGRALAVLMRRRDRAGICVGGDFRRTTEELKRSLVEGLLDGGVDVVDLGSLPTPAAYFGARHLGCDSVAIVTASHNPGRYNGVKFMLAGQPAVPELLDELRDAMSRPPRSKRRGAVRAVDLVPEYERRVAAQAAALLDRDFPASERPKRVAPRVVVEPMQGACAHIAPRVLAETGCAVTCLSSTIDPDFRGGPPNPAVDAHLSRLLASVRDAGAELGVALDGDGDRVVFVDAECRIVRPEQVAAVLIQHARRVPVAVYDLKCASLVARVTRDRGGSAIMQPSGHGFIKSTMIQRQAHFGVEVSGHHFFDALQGGDDGLFTTLVLLGIMRRTGKTLRELVQPFPWPLITPDLRVPFSGDAAAVVERIAGACGGRISRLDGVRAEFPGGWGLARASITEPALTFRFEGQDAESVRAIAARMVAAADMHSVVMEKINEWLARSTD